MNIRARTGQVQSIKSAQRKSKRKQANTTLRRTSVKAMLTRSELPLILFVDDDPDALASTAELFESLFNIKTAGSGHEALGKLEETPLPDIVIADLGMPGMNGHQLCEAIKSDARTRDITIIFLTGEDTTEAELEGFELGAADFIPKPVEPRTFVSRIRSHMRRKLERDRLQDLSEYLELRSRNLTQSS
ncbi:response regulator [Pseudomonas citronellolis]|uniref:response regulator n=1 Tax=Pseudomonas citronellolis TaxID=53408 RepID=UPI00209ED812|nr:response regulator [Pseudomonas citronellolis]MCP1605777.1 putative two-component system response regulator [Pseudomonas citronellolis]MCP1656068.1 putative two-component system response regulator [Pseudomonas citronellolis]MCP1722228.1 putative two-component system response regulator [Pseudomonas citronellolis]